MEDTLVLTEETIRDKARSYVPIAEKEAFIRSVSDNCFDRIAIGGGNGEEVPPMWKENGFIRQKYLAGALVKLYFGLEYATEAGDEWLPTDEEYDRIMANCPMNQIERIRKSSKDQGVRDKCYDLIYDFKALERLLSGEIAGMRPAANDLLTRFNRMIEAQTTPEAFEKLAMSAEELQKAMDELKSHRRQLSDGEGEDE